MYVCIYISIHTHTHTHIKEVENGYVILCLYVDEMSVVGSDDKMIIFTNNMLKSSFDMKNMGLANVILGIKIWKTSKKLILNQSHYMDKILRKFNKENYVGARTPLDTSLHLSMNRGEGSLKWNTLEW